MTRPDIEVGAKVKAKSLRFEQEPETAVEVEGRCLSEQERHDLPDEVEPA